MKKLLLLSLVIGFSSQENRAEPVQQTDPFESIQMRTNVHDQVSVYFSDEDSLLLRFYSLLNADRIEEVSKKAFGPISSVDLITSTSFEIRGFVINRFKSRNVYEVTEREGQIHLKRVDEQKPSDFGKFAEKARSAITTRDSLLAKLYLSDDAPSAAKNRRVLKALDLKKPQNVAEVSEEAKAEPQPAESSAKAPNLANQQKNLMNLMDEDIQASAKDEALETESHVQAETEMAEAKVDAIQSAEAPAEPEMPREFVTQTKGIQFEDDDEFSVPQFRLPEENF